jgi:hypothetical protein
MTTPRRLTIAILLSVALTGCSSTLAVVGFASPIHAMLGTIASTFARPAAAPSGSIVMFACTQVGFSANSCSATGKALPTSGELSAFQSFANKEAAAGYRFMGAGNILSFTKISSTGAVQVAEYYVFQAP